MSAPQDVVVSFDWVPQIGGAHTWLYEVYRRWPQSVAVVTAAGPKDSASAPPPSENLQVSRNAIVPADISLLSWRCWRDFLHTNKAIARAAGKVRRIHALRAFPEGISALLYQRTHARRAKLITYAHGEEILVARSSRQLRLLAQQVYAASDLIIANSENTSRLVRSLCPSAKVVCIHPGVDFASYQMTAEAVAAYRSQLGWNSHTVVVGTMARMEPRKNHAAVIKAVAALRREGLEVACVCAGAGAEHARLVELTRSLGIEPWVRFPGAVAEGEKRLLFAASDVYAMPSIQVGEMIEGFGIVFVEAGAAGKPAICGNSGGQAEAVIDGVTGCVVNGDDLEDVSRALRHLVIDAEREGSRACCQSRLAAHCPQDFRGSGEADESRQAGLSRVVAFVLAAKKRCGHPAAPHITY
jgi:phosphatidylinositol alpha-1,6-mannosyltransferase